MYSYYCFTFELFDIFFIFYHVVRQKCEKRISVLVLQWICTYLLNIILCYIILQHYVITVYTNLKIKIIQKRKKKQHLIG